MNDRKVFENNVGVEIEIRGIVAPVYAPRDGVVRDHQTPIKPVQVIVNDEVVGAVDHVNIFGGNVRKDVYNEVVKVIDSTEVGDIIIVRGIVNKYHRRNGNGGSWGYGVNQISKVEVRKNV